MEDSSCFSFYRYTSEIVVWLQSGSSVRLRASQDSTGCTIVEPLCCLHLSENVLLVWRQSRSSAIDSYILQTSQDSTSRAILLKIAEPLSSLVGRVVSVWGETFQERLVVRFWQLAEPQHHFPSHSHHCQDSTTHAVLLEDNNRTTLSSLHL